MKENKATTICGRKGVWDEVLELPLENHIWSYKSGGRQREDVINNIINKRDQHIGEHNADLPLSLVCVSNR